jgi:hypothetical protein
MMMMIIIITEETGVAVTLETLVREVVVSNLDRVTVASF